MLFPIQNLFLNTDSPVLETLMGLAKTNYRLISVFLCSFFSIYEKKNDAANF